VTIGARDGAVSRPEVRRRRWGDRTDGRLLRGLDPIYRMIPFIMPTRIDAHDYFEARIDVGPAEAWLRARRASGRGDLGYLHLFVAALVRTLSQHPRLNRFVAHRRIYARNEILISLAVKPRLAHDSPETVVKMRFPAAATVEEVAAILDAAVSQARATPAAGATDRLAKVLAALPDLVLGLAMALIRFLDRHGALPAAIHRASPFHASAFVTDLGSLGIGPIYHHLYEFGTVSLFLAFGRKEREHAVDAAGRIVRRHWISVKVVNDERICDGHAYASAFKFMLGLFRHPERLERPPNQVMEDVA
jgi:hypothetical protein